MRRPLRALRKFLMLGATALWCAGAARAGEVIAIEPLEKSFFIGSAPSLTLYWKGIDARAVLLFIPGGDGHLGLRPDQTNHRFHFYQMLRSLSEAELGGGRFDVVLLDSPAPLSPNSPYPAARGTADHLVRIESAVRFYRDRTGLPVWIMGHSNGGISLKEFVRHLQDRERTALVAGIIASGIRNETDFGAPYHWPTLFLHHAEDGCRNTQPSASRALFEKVREINRAPTEYRTITGGSPQGDPCTSGLHMYFGAGRETATALHDFLTRHAP